MQVSTKHPDYQDHETEWVLMDDAQSETTIKAAGTRYLPMPDGFAAQDDKGQQMYQSYQDRARFPEILAPSIQGMQGVIHSGETWRIELPRGLEYLRSDATFTGMTLLALLRAITRSLLLKGRATLMSDAPSVGGRPHLALYGARALINWQLGALYVLDESGIERDGFKWEDVDQYRVLRLDDGGYVQDVHRGDDDTPDWTVVPTRQGGGRLDYLPIVTASAQEVTPDPEKPPLYGVARAAVSAYQLHADYRHQLFNSGQETLFVINGSAPSAVGSGVVVELEGTPDRQADAKYVGPSGLGISAHKEAIEAERKAAIDAGAQLFGEGYQSQESGEARRLRLGGETASIKTVAETSAELLERALRFAADMAGANPDEVAVMPPAELLKPMLSASEAQSLVTSWQAGAFSYETLWSNLQRGRIAPRDRTAEQELQQIDREEVPPSGAETGMEE